MLDEPTLNLFATEDIGVSLSIDGPKSANDRHRIDHQGRSSFAAVEAALNRLKAYPKIYTGLIAVIDCTRVMQQLNNELEEIRLSLKTSQVASVDIEAFECPQTSSTSLQNLLTHWIAQARSEFKEALEAVLNRDPKKLDTIRQIQDTPSENLDSLVIRPSVVLWTTVMQQSASGITVCSIDGDPIAPDKNYVESLADWLKVPNELVPYVHRNDPWLRLPFGQRIVFESDEVAAVGTAILKESLSVIESWRPTLLAEIKKLSPEIQFIQDLTAHPDKVVSFSDNSVPGALYVSIRQGTGFIDPYNLADSIIHEHRHQKLYLLQRVVPLVEVDTPFVPSPWREDLRPPSGLLHAVFVFTHLLEFWNYLVSEGPSHLKTYASEQVTIIRTRLNTAIPTLKGTRLTLVGVELVEKLESITANIGAVEV